MSDLVSGKIFSLSRIVSEITYLFCLMCKAAFTIILSEIIFPVLASLPPVLCPTLLLPEEVGKEVII